MKIVEESVKYELCSRIGKYVPKQYSFHWHNRYEICRLLRGRVSFLVDGRLIEAGVGDIIAIDEQTVHRFIVEQGDALVRINQFPLGVILNTGAAVKPIRTHISADEIQNIPGLNEALDTLYALMDGEDGAVTARDNPYFTGLCASFYFLLMRHFSADDGAGGVKNDRLLFFKITEYANQHFKENINVNSISSSLYIPRGRLTSLFLRYSGTGLNGYINALRVSRANQLMENGCNVTEAALESGFQSIRTFNNTYKEMTGMTPSEYIKSRVGKKGTESKERRRKCSELE